MADRPEASSVVDFVARAAQRVVAPVERVCVIRNEPEQDGSHSPLRNWRCTLFTMARTACDGATDERMMGGTIALEVDASMRTFRVTVTPSGKVPTVLIEGARNEYSTLEQVAQREGGLWLIHGLCQALCGVVT